jgi:hypothetical protein
MSNEKTTVVDFIAKDKDGGGWKMVLVEEGPWQGPVEDQLRRIQKRLFGCIDAAVTGQLATKFPESKGSSVTIQLDCYNVPKPEVAHFFERFSQGALRLSPYKEEFENQSFVGKLLFEVNFDQIH